MKYIGNLLQKVGEREGDSQNGHWKVASYLLQTVEQYPKKLVVDVSDGMSARIAQWDGMIGKNVEIQFNIDAHEYNGRWINNMRAWSIVENAPKTQASAPQTSNQADSQSTNDVDWDGMN